MLWVKTKGHVNCVTDLLFSLYEVIKYAYENKNHGGFSYCYPNRKGLVHESEKKDGLKTSFGVAWENSQHCAMPPLVSPWNDVWETSAEIPYWWWDSASDWLCHVGNLIEPIRSNSQIWVVTHHQYGISVLIFQMSFGGETSGSGAKCRLFFLATFGVIYYIIFHSLFLLHSLSHCLSTGWIL